MKRDADGRVGGRATRRTLLVAGCVAGLTLLGAAVVFRLANDHADKPRLEVAASQALGLDVRVRGRIEIRAFPRLHMKLDDVHVYNHRGAEVASSKQASIWIELLPLLRGDVRIHQLALTQPSLSIARDHDGGYNVAGLEHAVELIRSRDLPILSMSDASLLYRDAASGKEFELRDFDLTMKRLLLRSGNPPGLLERMSFTAEIACHEARASNVSLSDLKLTVVGGNEVFDFDPATLRIFGGTGSGRVRADLSGPVPSFTIRCSLRQFHIDEFFGTLSPKKTAEGAMDFSANLAMQGKTANELMRTAQGEVMLRGQSLTLNGDDVDQVIRRFESSQNFSLVDVGAFFLAGPFGPVITKGFNFASTLRGASGESRIQTLVSEWRVGHGVAQATDVAMATKTNRIAMKGGLDFVNQRFVDVTLAVIDANGCARVQQQVHGPFAKPVVEKPRALTSLVAPVSRLLGKLRAILPGGPCEVFYAGSVPPPEEK